VHESAVYSEALELRQRTQPVPNGAQAWAGEQAKLPQPPPGRPHWDHLQGLHALGVQAGEPCECTQAVWKLLHELQAFQPQILQRT